MLENRYISKAQLFGARFFAGRDSQYEIHQLVGQCIHIAFGQQSSGIEIQS